MTGGLLVVLAVLTGNVLAHGPLVGLDEHIRDAVQAPATSPAWRWLNALPVLARPAADRLAVTTWPCRCSR